MAGAANLGSYAEGTVDVTLQYGDNMKATSLTVVNSGTEPFDLRIVGVVDGAEDPNRTYGKIWQPGTDSVAIGQGVGNSITLSLNSRGKLTGFSVYTGGAAPTVR